MGSTLIPPNADDELARRHKALRVANQIRTARAALLGRLHALPGAESCGMAAEIVWDPPDVLHSMRVFDFLIRVRSVGEDHAERMLEAAQIRGLTTLGQMTPRQRAALESLLRAKGERLCKRDDEVEAA